MNADVKFGMIRAVALGIVLLATAAVPLGAAPPQHEGRIAGVVVDPSGTPQMGATVMIAAEQLRGTASQDLLTNAAGQFATDRLLPGLYSARVTLAGFLPVIEQHIRVSGGTTLLHLELGSVFSSLERLRRPANQPADPDEWSWVLRTSASARPVLRFEDGEVVYDGESSSAETAANRQPHGRLELTSGARHPGSVSNLADSPGGAFAYDQHIGIQGRLLMAGQFSYESAIPSGGFATVWLPTGDAKTGPSTSLVMRESRVGSEGLAFRGLKMSHDSGFALGDRLSVHYGAEYIMAGLGRETSALRPRGELTMEISPTWHGAMIVAAQPWPDSDFAPSALEAAVNSLDSFPTVMYRDGRPVLQGGWHEELAVEHAFGSKASLIASAFHDRSDHTAVFGRGDVSGPDFLRDGFYTNAFAYDGGTSASLGARIAYRQKFSDNLEMDVVYAYAGALSPATASVPGENLRDMLETHYRESLGGRVSSKLPRTKSQVIVGYKWISGPVVSRQDPYGEALYHLDPNLSFTFRQPLPSFFPCHMEAIADFGNLLAQGYVPIVTNDGRVLLVPSYRTFRGGVSFQF